MNLDEIFVLKTLHFKYVHLCIMDRHLNNFDNILGIPDLAAIFHGKFSLFCHILVHNASFLFLADLAKWPSQPV